MLGAPAYHAGGQAGPRGAGGHGWGRLLGDDEGRARLLLHRKLQDQTRLKENARGHQLSLENAVELGLVDVAYLGTLEGSEPLGALDGLETFGIFVGAEPFGTLGVVETLGIVVTTKLLGTLDCPEPLVIIAGAKLLGTLHGVVSWRDL